MNNMKNYAEIVKAAKFAAKYSREVSIFRFCDTLVAYSEDEDFQNSFLEFEENWKYESENGGDPAEMGRELGIFFLETLQTRLEQIGADIPAAMAKFAALSKRLLACYETASAGYQGRKIRKALADSAAWEEVKEEFRGLIASVGIGTFAEAN